jgi:hypothetical protein
MRSGLAAHVGVSAAAALAGVCLAGGPLYVSSAASEAVQLGLERTCLTEAGLVVQLARSAGRAEDALLASAPAIAHTQPPLVTETVAMTVHPAGAPSPTRVVLLDRTGQYDALGTAPLREGDALAPDWAVPIAGLSPGVSVDAVPIGPTPSPVELTIRELYPGIAVNPEPTYWCGVRNLLRPSPLGDPPPPMLVIDETTFLANPALTLSRIVEVRPDPNGLTRAEAQSLSDELDALAAAYEAGNPGPPSGGPVGLPIRGARWRNGLPVIINYAETLSEVVARTVAPVRVAGLAAAALLLVTAGAMLTRSRANELRLRVLRGVSPIAVGARVGGAAAVAVAVGMLIGFGLAVLGVATLGPTPELEPGSVRTALSACVAGAVAGTVVIGLVAAALSSRSVDARPRHQWARWVPWELVLVALAIVSYRRLDRAGGVRLVGAEARGGDLLAQAFPLLALSALLVVCARPLRFALRRLRDRGRRLPVPLLVGIRRLSADAGVTVLGVLGVALVVGSITMSAALTDSATRMLHEKAGTFLGGETIVSVYRFDALPESLAANATVVARARAHDGDTRVDLLGVDPDTLARGIAALKPSDRDVDALLRTIAGGGSQPLPAIVVHGSLPTGVLRVANGTEVTVQPVAAADWFPGYSNGATLVVVDRAALEDTALGLATEVWLRDDDGTATAQIAASGALIRGSRSVDDVFDATSFLTVRWSYAVLTAFGVVIAVVVVTAQALVLDARRRARQGGAILGRRMGFSVGDEARATFVELAVPFVVGAALGIVSGVVVVQLAIDRLDTLRNLQPPAHVVLDLGNVVGALAVGMLALVMLALIGTITMARVRPMEAMRSAE